MAVGTVLHAAMFAQSCSEKCTLSFLALHGQTCMVGGEIAAMSGKEPNPSIKRGLRRRRSLRADVDLHCQYGNRKIPNSVHNSRRSAEQEIARTVIQHNRSNALVHEGSQQSC